MQPLRPARREQAQTTNRPARLPAHKQRAVRAPALLRTPKPHRRLRANHRGGDPCHRRDCDAPRRNIRVAPPRCSSRHEHDSRATPDRPSHRQHHIAQGRRRTLDHHEPTLREHLQRMSRIGKVINPAMGEIVYPAPRGGYMRRSTWPTHWHSVRASAGIPGQDFCELKHRAIQWMIDPTNDGGLGLDFQTVAQIVGHNDNGHLIATVYTKLTQHHALTRAQHAMNTYQQHLTTTPEHDHQTGPNCNGSAKESPSARNRSAKRRTTHKPEHQRIKRRAPEPSPPNPQLSTRQGRSSHRY
jgi:hypothetical protein